MPGEEKKGTNKTIVGAIILAIASVVANIVSIFSNNSYATIVYVDKQIKRSDEITVIRYTQIAQNLTTLQNSVNTISGKLYLIATKQAKQKDAR